MRSLAPRRLITVCSEFATVLLFTGITLSLSPSSKLFFSLFLLPSLMFCLFFAGCFQVKVRGEPGKILICKPYGCALDHQHYLSPPPFWLSSSSIFVSRLCCTSKEINWFSVSVLLLMCEGWGLSVFHNYSLVSMSTRSEVHTPCLPSPCSELILSDTLSHSQRHKLWVICTYKNNQFCKPI